jgi:NADH dehydrogenase
MTLVVGATGRLGLEICSRLQEAGDQVAAFVRPGAAGARGLADAGVSLQIGDLKQRASVHRACEGHRVVVSTATATTRARPGDTLHTVDRDGQIALVEAARRAGVRRFVYVSVSPNAAPRSALVVCKREVERAVRASGMDWVIVQPTAFMEMWLSPRLGWDFQARRVWLMGPGDRPASLVALTDVAAFCARAATDRRAINRDVPFGGPGAITPLDVVRVAESALGVRLRVRHIPAPLLGVAATLLRPVAPIPAALLALGVHAASQGDVVPMTDTIREFSLSLTTVETYLSSLLRPPGAV